jgi:hypothetical protein
MVLLGITTVLLTVFLVIHFKVIPDIIVDNTDDKYERKKKLSTYSWLNAVLFIIIMGLSAILGGIKLFSAGTDSSKEIEMTPSNSFGAYSFSRYRV